MSNGGPADIVTVEIFGGQYAVRSGLDAEYVKRVAQYVDRKMHNAADQTRGGAIPSASRCWRRSTSPTSISGCARPRPAAATHAA